MTQDFPVIILGLAVFGTQTSKQVYSHLSNKRGGWNKCGGGAKVTKSLNVEVGINVEGRILLKKTNA